MIHESWFEVSHQGFADVRLWYSCITSILRDFFANFSICIMNLNISSIAFENHFHWRILFFLSIHNFLMFWIYLNSNLKNNNWDVFDSNFFFYDSSVHIVYINRCKAIIFYSIATPLNSINEVWKIMNSFNTRRL